MESIQEPTSLFQFSNLLLTPPTNLSGGNHFMKLSLNDNPLYIQTPKCKTKQSIIKNGKRSFLDLTFTNENEEFIQWIENLEMHCQTFIYSKREHWFDSTLEEHDIENLFTSILKHMKMGKIYLLRANIPLVPSILKIYDENENLMNLEDLKEDTNIICILEFKGIKCSARGFQVEIEIKQILVLKPSNIFERCILSKKRDSESSTITIPVLENSSNQEEKIFSVNENKIILDDMEDIEDSLDLQIKQPQIIVTEEDLKLKNDEILDEKKENIENKTDLLEIDLNLEEVPMEDSVILKQRNDVYYEMYKEALKKAKMAKDLALSSYLEAKRIKNLYMLDDLSDDSDLEDFIGEDEEGS